MSKKIFHFFQYFEKVSINKKSKNRLVYKLLLSFLFLRFGLLLQTHYTGWTTTAWVDNISIAEQVGRKLANSCIARKY